MNKSENKVLNLFTRYLLIALLGIGNLFIFYFIFTKPTVLASNFLLKLVSPTQLFGNSILFKQTLITLIPACIAGSAYYLLTILALALPNMKIKRRLSLLAFLFSTLFIFNVLRIFVLSLINKINLFNTIHLLTWYFVTTAFVIALWFLAVNIFEIKEIPVYSDVKYLYSKTKSKKTKKSKRSKKN